MKNSESNFDANSETIQSRPEVGEVMDYIRHIFRALRVASSKFEKDIGLSAAQVFVLKKLKDEPGLSINDLANRTVTHQSSVSVVVKKLEESMLVQRSTSREDSRKVVVFLTPAGEEKLAGIPRTIQEDMIETLKTMPPEKTQQLAELMKEFVLKSGIVSELPAPMFEHHKSNP